jgi:hypothetical protein
VTAECEEVGSTASRRRKEMSLEERNKGVIAATATKDQCELSIYLINKMGSIRSQYTPNMNRTLYGIKILTREKVRHFYQW